MQRTTERCTTMLARLRHRLGGTAADERGQSMVEYAVVTVLLAAAALVALNGFGDSVKGAFDAIVAKIPTT